MATTSGPILSTPAEHIFEDPTPVVLATQAKLSDEQLYLQYEIKRTVGEIREGRWKRIALQFPDEMLVDAPRVFERLREDLKAERRRARETRVPAQLVEVSDGLPSLTLDDKHINAAPSKSAVDDEDSEERLCILADTSYGACCVDEIAAEHVDAEVVVHYGRSCLSPTARLPVIYVFTSKPLDIDEAVASFLETYPAKDEKVCLMADIPYHHNLPALTSRLLAEGYTNLFQSAIIHDPSSLLPNRTLPPDVQEKGADQLKAYAIFHISKPPTSLLLILSSRVRSIHIPPTSSTSPLTQASSPLSPFTTSTLLRRRYALLTQLTTAPILGILINTLSVSSFLSALTHCQNLITAAGKKYHVFVVGKVNAAKMANFSEIGGWVVIGCWESSLVEEDGGGKGFWRPVVTPFELEVALMGDGERVWGEEWVGDFGTLLGRAEGKGRSEGVEAGAGKSGSGDGVTGDWDEQVSDEDEPPEFDLRTGRYVSHSRPMGRPTNKALATSTSNDPMNNKASSALVARNTKTNLSTINGALSPAAEFLKSNRTWQGLGSDYKEIAYERDEDGGIRGAGMEEGRQGVAKGYVVGGGEVRS
ncbi:Diphthamide biosynthesis protein 2 [Friedmanniomyces endolithicus]|uniref:2-(3-amino-3-carboxypropyl)histidine synthase subunit 2 n=1 Tax=Friedmanniomyces endolithicus TaxID=329885 RepID=A0AAN6G1V1_9PEZI|nr:Diphthamide biosynthesis protein 2 [Friedmanniomyces endolithicus]KAK0283839.1 Diphthamide biosynthesis protein 2 [Friedmanniomyces endolithicus]KAK0327411.1 Diphthamide biosynthesis protein 2 [Friedmanniomyces endolithicus]KAK0990432.1 Diphthamide biosynthesis protein 2 [Friedmanniomyces endolithicus]